jgi:hypothetical protein
MKISSLFGLGKSQAELDFVDIDTKSDIPLFLDPFFLGQRTDRWSIEATRTLKSFFQEVIDRIKDKKLDQAKALFNNLHEPNDTCLGVSASTPQGNGLGVGDTDKIFTSLIKSKAVQTGLLQDLEDNVLFVEKFGKDKLSDMTTNIIRKQLLAYTRNQCVLHNIPLSPKMPSGFFWSRQNKTWNNEYTDRLVVDNKPLLLVPKGIVSFASDYTPDKYYNNFVLEFLQNEELNLKSALVKERASGKKYVTKKDLKEKYPQGKEFLRRFTLEHPEVLDEFKQKTKSGSLKNYELSDENIKKLCSQLGSKLVGIPSGKENAGKYHHLIIGILELLFYPFLINPVKEAPRHSGRKRIDITFDNAAKDGFFYRLHKTFKIPCGFIFVECKNYSSDPENPELDQLAGRFSVNAGQVGVLVCRNFEKRQLFIERCKDTYNDGRGLIIPLSDQDLINLLDNHADENYAFINKYLSDLMREITL